MRLLWDWRLARLVESDGTVHDEAVWTGVRGPGATAKRLHSVLAGRLTPEARDLDERFPEAERSGDPASQPDIDWPALSSDEAKLLDDAAMILARRAVADAAADIDRRLEHLVDATGELRAAWTTLEARVVEWVGLFLADLDLDTGRGSIVAAVAAADDIDSMALGLALDAPAHKPLDDEWRALRDSAVTCCELQVRLDAAEAAIRTHAKEYLPSLSALLGPLLAARLCVSAHGRARLARLPSSTLQVLGAEKAFFSHLRSGTPVPKHGMIFQHPWISRSPRWIRGKVSRMLAGKATIAVRIDHFGGEPWTAERIAEVESAVGRIRKQHPRPKAKRRGGES